MTIIINGVIEIVHTSCSAVYVAGQPAPLDGNTPNPPNSSKGDPSPNWWVVDFKQKDGIIIAETSDDGQSGADNCTVPFGGGNVTYNYTVKNTGSTDVDVTSVLDDKLGQILTTSPTFLESGASFNLSSDLTSIEQLTTNTVLVDANVSDNADIKCAATDAVTVNIEPAPQLACKEIKPISQLSMVWGGLSGVDIRTEGGQLFSNVQNGNKITFDTLGLGNDVDLTISGSENGLSRFHVSCSDEAMNGPEDCGVGFQGDNKNNESGLINQWLLESMIGDGGSFNCAVPNTGIVDPANGDDGGETDSVRIEIKEVKGKELKFYIINDGSTNLLIERITTTWPVHVNGELTEIKRGSSKIYDTDTSDSPATITSWVDKEDKRIIKAGDKQEFKFKYAYDADKDLSSYSTEIEFNTGTIVTLP